MQGNAAFIRKRYGRPLVLAALFTLPGAAAAFVFWGMLVNPGGNVLAQLFCAVASGIGMTLAIGLMVGFIVSGRYEGAIAGVISSFCYATVMIAVILICYEVDMALDLFGARRDPALFVMTSVVPALLTTPIYGWLLHGKLGKAIFTRLGL
jgi:vacuolar-type H+-ATPase subunit I/STV1